MPRVVVTYTDAVPSLDRMNVVFAGRLPRLHLIRIGQPTTVPQYVVTALREQSTVRYTFDRNGAPVSHPAQRTYHVRLVKSGT
jgi:hypothetical protein